MYKRALIAITFVALLGLGACGGDSLSPTAPPPESYDLDSPSLSALGKMPKVNICHATGTGFNLININGNAVNGHTGHGDIYPVPEDGCPGLACATFDGLSVTGSFPVVTVSWTDSVNTTTSYVVEGLYPDGSWQDLTSPIPSDPSGSYLEGVFTLPFVSMFRVSASCGVVSDAVPLS